MFFGYVYQYIENNIVLLKKSLGGVFFFFFLQFEMHKIK
jgi:hypothetical protein